MKYLSPAAHSAATAILVTFLAAPITLFAHIDELSQVLAPDPLVVTHEAESLPVTGATRVAEDPLARQQKALVLKGPDAGVALDFGQLDYGIYCVWVCAKVIEEGAVADSIDLQRLANTALTLEFQGKSIRISSDSGSTWTDSDGTISAAMLGDGQCLVRVR